jgi:hypothetical protein
MTDLLNSAQAKYGFLKNLGMQVKVNPRQDTGMYAETWPAEEPGSNEAPRPSDIPLNVHGVEIFKPDQFNEDDLAGEALHVDPVARRTSTALTKSLSDAQIERLAIHSNDYEQSLKLGMSQEDAMRNAVDSMIRGYVVGQWPKEVIDDIGLRPEQLERLEALREYANSGVDREEVEQKEFEKAGSE